MEMRKLRGSIILFVFFGFLPLTINAEDRRVIPLDLYLIVDGSTFLGNSKADTIAWINRYVVDRILMDGDRVTIWTAGETAEIIYSETVSGAGGINAIKEKITAINTTGRSADFSGALGDVSARISQTDGSRLAVTMLITGEAGGLEPVLTGSAGNFLRWSRSEKYERWQVFVVGPNIGARVRQAAAAYMSSSGHS